jgi:hypothetical protein
VDPVVVRADPCAALAAAYKLSDMVDGAIDLVVLDIPSVAPNTRRLWVKQRRVGQHVGRNGVRIMVPNKMTRHDVVQLEENWITCQCLVRSCMRPGRRARQLSQLQANY